MKGYVFGTAWALVLLAATYDGYFAWENRAAFQYWEQNRVACWIAGTFGVKGVLAVKAAGLVFAGVVAFHCRRRRHRLATPLTVVAACSYLLLSVHYAAGHLQTAQPLRLAETAAASGTKPVVASGVRWQR